MAQIVEVLAGAGLPQKRTQIPAGDEKDVLKHYSETLIRKLEEKMLQLEEANRTLRQEITERRAAEEEANFKNMILKTQQEASLDAILVVGENGEILSTNRRFIDLWEVPESMVKGGHYAPLLKHVSEKTMDVDAYVSKVQGLYDQHEEKSHDELQFRDGKTIDRFSAPIMGTDGKYYGRVWFFRDITEQRQALMELEKSESWFRSIFENANTGIAS
ncbi:MAG TPA: PAS-domain containing protein, partial [Burkholderiales bacterium]|nr:PAS-domain containing protein [Burkholderiales bacterium]